MHLQDIDSENGAGQTRKDGPGVIRQSDPAPIARAKKRYHVQPDLFRRAGVGRSTLQHRQGQPVLPDPLNGGIDFAQRTHPGRQKYRPARFGDTLQHQRIVDFAGSHLPGCHSYATEQLDRLERERRTEKLQSAVGSVMLKASPLVLAELHSFPVLEAGCILRAELDAPGFSRSRFCRSDMGLELDGVGSGACCCLDVGMSHPEAAVVSLGYFGHDQARSAR
jgi:hypothetical protein